MTQIINEPNIKSVSEYFKLLQNQIISSLEKEEDGVQFSLEKITLPSGGTSQPRVLSEGKHIEKAAVMFTYSLGDSLPAAATLRNPDLAGRAFQATAISLIIHPRNPYVPMTHMNLRFFIVMGEEPAWHFGGGYDLTPYYPYEEDIIHWHSVASAAAGQHYHKLKAACDEYFYLSHRKEARGIGGLFFDDWVEGGFDDSFSFVKKIGNSFLDAYSPIFSKRKTNPYGDSEKDFQLFRRGRYAEFNLAIDRGTKYGLQSGRRIESVLASLPPLAKWSYNYPIEPNSSEARLTEYFLKPKDWI
ncbi:oxygen-dependent coproporphyrinogen oxidase [Gammaproteobacteria bacterium]|nr:oxygen-dependent coproporphyrinogen oxidase [Gammaproteobacteria bacterium]